LTKHYRSDAKSVDQYLKCVNDVHSKISENKDVLLRYLTFVTREQEPVEVFRNLEAAFQAAAESPLIVGVNIVEREDGPLSMKDYKLHMMMFRYLKSKYDSVKCSLHAGELTLGLVKPEDLSFHINDAVFIARADRIGHGVDIPYEKDAFKLLQYMSAQKIPVEINLSSNEFILKVSGEQHPVMLYKNQNVPIIISTDDAGILRTNLTRQYVLLAQRYPDFGYKEIKDIIFNSVDYSFIEETQTKNLLRDSLKGKIALFEQQIIQLGANVK
jgi:adenosine deaminase